MQIRTRLTLQFVLAAGSIFCISFTAIYYLAERSRRQELYFNLKNKAETTADLLFRVEEVDSSLLKIIDKNNKDILYNENISVYDISSTEIYTNNDTIHFYKILPDFTGILDEIFSGKEIVVSADGNEVIGIRYEIRGRVFAILAGATDHKGKKNIENLKHILLLTFFSVLIVVGIAGRLFAGRALRPISSIISQVNTISANNLDNRLKEGKHKDEITKLTSTFNHMLTRISHAFHLQKNFVSNASHELRNPLTSVTSQLEVSLLKNRTGEEYKQTIVSALEDIKRLNEVTQRLLQLAKITGGNKEAKFSSIRIDELLWKTKKEFLDAYADYKVEFFLKTLPTDERFLHIEGNETLLKTCFFNLMENACKFSNDNSVTIRLFPDYESIQVHFSDNGIGIPESDMPYIFEPFFRGVNGIGARGHGIGLSIVEKIVHLHNAKIEVKSARYSETVFSLQFKRMHF